MPKINSYNLSELLQAFFSEYKNEVSFTMISKASGIKFHSFITYKNGVCNTPLEKAYAIIQAVRVYKSDFAEDIFQEIIKKIQINEKLREQSVLERNRNVTARRAAILSDKSYEEKLKRLRDQLTEIATEIDNLPADNVVSDDDWEVRIVLLRQVAKNAGIVAEKANKACEHAAATP